MMDKIVYMDGEKSRMLKGRILSHDDYFVTMELDNSQYQISKKYIISMRQDKNGEKTLDSTD